MTPNDPGTFYASHPRTRYKAVRTSEKDLWATAKKSIGSQMACVECPARDMNKIRGVKVCFIRTGGNDTALGLINVLDMLYRRIFGVGTPPDWTPCISGSNALLQRTSHRRTAHECGSSFIS